MHLVWLTEQMFLINYQVLSSALGCTKTEGESYCFLRDETLLGMSCATQFKCVFR